MTLPKRYHFSLSLFPKSWGIYLLWISLQCFQKRHLELSILFLYSKIIKIADKVKIENCLFINECTNNKLPSIFTNMSTLSPSHNYQTLFASKVNLQIPSVQTTYEKKCFCLYSYKNLEWYSERSERCNVEHIFIS